MLRTHAGPRHPLSPSAQNLATPLSEASIVSIYTRICSFNNLEVSIIILLSIIDYLDMICHVVKHAGVMFAAIFCNY